MKRKTTPKKTSKIGVIERWDKPFEYFGFLNLVLMAFYYGSLWFSATPSDVDKVFKFSILMAFEFIMVHSGVMMAMFPAKLRLFVAGNHEIFFDSYPQKAKSLIPPEITLLENSGIHFADIHFHSVVARPYLKTPAQMPNNVDFLITHSPIKGVLDLDTGCPDLRDLVMKHRPKFHLFGHIHQHGLQQTQTEATTFCNVSYFDHLSAMIVNDFSTFLSDKNIL